MQKPIILVTGASRGIGLETVRGLAERGAQVILTARDESRAQQSAQRVGAAFACALDINDDASIRRVAAAVEARFGHLDVLINNAAILLDHYQNLQNLTPQILQSTLETNVVGTFRVTLGLLPLLRKSSAPRILNVSSGAGQLDGEPQSFAPAYSISKTALNMLTQQMAAALPGVAVNSVCPGWCRTEMGGGEAPRSAEDGAAGIIWLALDAPQNLRAGFFRDRQRLAW